MEHGYGVREHWSVFGKNKTTWAHDIWHDRHKYLQRDRQTDRQTQVLADGCMAECMSVVLGAVLPGSEGYDPRVLVVEERVWGF
ncbi:hypothetical protein VTJ04DRAFT_9137 [Mycothermus thermophilus]|uniref:uncharacterized protein n=1 Tax=Humicola insolens TaxID=85995 RepID=UPI003742400C